jgi:hypothetical protein
MDKMIVLHHCKRLHARITLAQCERNRNRSVGWTGVPEADSDEQALEALEAFADQVRDFLTRE